MSLELEIYNGLVDEIRSIVAIKREILAVEALEMHFLIGDAILNSGLYLKGKHGSKEVIDKLAEELNISDHKLYLCIQAKEKWGEVSRCRESLANELQKPAIFWSDVVKALPEKTKTVKEKTDKCKHCKIHCE